jgi:hypothetical protein
MLKIIGRVFNAADRTGCSLTSPSFLRFRESRTSDIKKHREIAVGKTVLFLLNQQLVRLLYAAGNAVSPL